ncbi:cardiolipin synthase [Bacillus sp. ISL-39]|uniref:cardiolipin synthase n=1 Tax=Bacillus sp. ISL-39 TaxID=2819124 RepID=UPI001BEC52E7|nr:cardiolipin synthase [Bacillus sp. ISL-39]
MRVLRLVGLLFIWMRVDFMLGKKLRSRQLREYPVRRGETEFFGNGTYYFDKLFHDISEAESTIHLSFYRFKYDSFGMKLLELLEKKAKEGVKVRLLLDLVGSIHFPRKAVNDLKRIGIEFAYSHKPSFPLFFTTLNRRNHHKIIVLDGQIGYLGGFNVGDNYAEKDSEIGFWRDYMVRINGSGTEDLQKEFLEDWVKAGMECNESDSLYPQKEEGDSYFRMISSCGGFLDEKLLPLIHSADKSIILGSPYFVPTPEVKTALVNAKERGVEIKIVLPEKSDHLLVKERAFEEFSDLIPKGIKLYLYKKGFYHAKIMLLDDNAAYVGTSNFDVRSFRTNDEMILFTRDKKMLEKIADNLQADFENSEKQELHNVQGRGAASRVKRTLAKLFQNFL